MRGLKTEFFVGVFALAVFAALSFMTFKVGGFTLWQTPGYTVYVYFENTAGLDERTKIKIAGVDVGAVEKIELAGSLAKVTLRLYPGVKLYSDATAYIKATGLLGDKFLEIKAGSTAPLLEDGDTIENVIEVADIDELIRNLTDVSLDIARLASDLNKLISETDIKDSLKQTMANLRHITGDLKDVISGNKEKFQAVIDRVDSLTASLDELIKTNRAPLTNTLANLEKFSGALGSEGPSLLEKLNASAGEIKALLEKSRPDIEKIAENARSITEKINSGQGTLGKLVHDDELYTSISNAAVGLSKAISTVERLRTFITFKGNYFPAIEDGKGYLSLTLQPEKNKYYILGVLDDPIGSVEEEDTFTVKNGVLTVEEEKKVKAGIQFTAQFARRYKNTALRGGLTENTFGVGADQFFFSDRLRFALDAWDFRKQESEADSPHVTFGADYFLFKNLFVSGGVDNILNSNRIGAYVGGGVRFEDKDLKYILGALPGIP